MSIRCGQDEVYGRREMDEDEKEIEREMEGRKAYLYRGCCRDIA